MRGLIVINGYPNGEKFYRQGERIQRALCDLGVETDVYKNGDVFAILQSNGDAAVALSKKYDFAVYLDKDKYLGYMLEKAGMRLFNSACAVETCDDKMTTYLALQGSGLTMPQTIAAPLCYTPNAKPNENFLKKVGATLGFPLVAKKSYGSFGMGVQLVHGMPELQKIAQEWLYAPHFYQQYISSSCGRDIRVIVVGGKAVGAMERVAQKGEFRSNIELGGVGKKIEADEAYLLAAERAAKTIGLDYCGVDLLETQDGPMVCEVNSNAFFEGFEAVTGIDVAAMYAAYIAACVERL